MCGIFGAVALRESFAREAVQLFDGLTDLVSHRGPDDASFVTFVVRRTDIAKTDAFDVYLGHRRLSIIDLSALGRQPMTDEHGNCIVFNGEIFNYLELRAELRALGHRFNTNTDTEVILRAYSAWGIDGFAKLNGMWAFALYDASARRLVLCRDRFSIKPLYYTQTATGFFFGSEIKQLLPLLPHAQLDRAVMHRFLVQAVADDSPNTFYTDIKQLPAKHAMEVSMDTGRISTRPYWHYSPTCQSSPQESLAQFRELFVDSVRIRLRSDVDVGALLSGGLDSSAIVVVANKILGADLSTYSIVGNASTHSEERFIDLLAHNGVRTRKITFEDRAAWDSLAETLRHNDEPFLGFHSVAHFLMLKSLRSETGIKVVLSGQGGDEALCGYSKYYYFYLAELLARHQYLSAMHAAFASLLRRTTLWQFRLSEAQRYLPWRKPVRPSYILTDGELANIGRARSLADRQILDIDRFSVPVQTHFEDRNSMAHSLEIRSPFLDHRLINLCLGIHDRLKFGGGWSKYVLRSAIPELPPKIRWRRDKQGFVTPEEIWLKRDFRKSITELFVRGKSFLAAAGIIDEREFLKHYDRFLRGDPRIWYAEISRVVIAELWARQSPAFSFSER